MFGAGSVGDRDIVGEDVGERDGEREGEGEGEGENKSPAEAYWPNVRMRDTTLRC